MQITIYTLTEMSDFGDGMSITKIQNYTNGADALNALNNAINEFKEEYVNKPNKLNIDTIPSHINETNGTYLEVEGLYNDTEHGFDYKYYKWHLTKSILDYTI